MKPTQRTDAIRNIRKKIISFLSVALIVALGIGGFFATIFMNQGLKVQGENWYDQHNFRDFEIASSAGFSEEDIAEIAAVPGVEAAEGLQNVTANLSKGEKRKIVQLLTATTRVSVPEVVEGSLPQAKNECMVSTGVAAETGIRPGDTVGISLADPSVKEDLLAVHQYTVTGIMVHPEYLRPGITSSVVVPRESFDHEKTSGFDAHAFVRVTKPAGVSIFSDKYFDKTADIEQRLEQEVKILEKQGTKRIRKTANDRIDREWEKAETKLAEAKGELEDAEAKLAAALKEGQKKLKNAERKIREGEKKLKKAEKELKKARKLLGDLTPKDVRDILDDALKITNEMKQAVDSNNEQKLKKSMEDARVFVERKDVQKLAKILQSKDAQKLLKLQKHKALNKILKYADKFEKQYKDGNWVSIMAYLQNTDLLTRLHKELKSLRKSIQKLVDAPSLIAKEKRRLNDAKNRLAAGWETYYSEKEKNEQKLADAWEQYYEQESEAKDELDDARRDANELEGHGVVMNLRCNAGYVDLKTNISAISSAGMVFGILFLLVGAMVCFSTLALIIEEQRQLVGTTKAFGLRGNEILGKYLVFGISSAIIGSILGVAMAMGLANLVLQLINRSGMYAVQSFSPILLPVPSVFAGLVALTLCGVVSAAACSGLLRTPASLLMKGNTLSKNRARERMLRRAERKSANSSSNRGSLFSHLILRNMREDRARVILTIAIIAGSCFIIGLGFTTRFGFTGMMQAQQTKVHAYDTRVELGVGVTDEQVGEMKQYLDSRDVGWVPATYEAHLYRTDGQVEAVYVLSANAKQIPGIFTLRDPKTHDPVTLPEEGILIGNRLHETKHLDPGDSLELYGTDLAQVVGTIAGQYQCYEGRVIILSEKSYQEVFGSAPVDNELYLRYNGANKKEIQEGLQTISKDISFEDSDAFMSRFAGSLAIYNTVVAIMIAIAMTMSFMILMNLTNIFVSRKKKEVIVMRVNGFSMKQTDRYLALETAFMSVGGLLLAMIAGFITTPLFIRVLEQPDVQFIRTPSPVLWGAAVLIEAVFILIISVIAIRKTRRYQLREIAES